MAKAKSKSKRRVQVRADGLPTTLSVREACEIAKCTDRTIRNWMADERFAWSRPVPRGSSRVYIDRASFLAWIGVDDVEAPPTAAELAAVRAIRQAVGA